MRDAIKDREHKLGEVTVGSEFLCNREKNLLKEIDLLKRENELLRKENYDVRADADRTIHQKKNEGFALLENENLKFEMQRLFCMLKTTKEYKDLANKADASGSIHYLKSIGKFSKVDLADRYKELKNLDCHRPDLFVDEKILWVPSEAFKFAHEFRIKYNGQLTETLIEHLLFELNKIWSRREDRLLGMVKGKYSAEAEFLRRKLAGNPSLE